MSFRIGQDLVALTTWRNGPKKGQIVTVSNNGWTCACGHHNIQLAGFVNIPGFSGARCPDCHGTNNGRWFRSEEFRPLERSTEASREIVEKWKEGQLPEFVPERNKEGSPA